MKYPKFRLAPLVALIVPLILCASALFVSPGCGGGGSSSTPVPTTAAVGIAFVGAPPTEPPVFRNIFFNISAVRLNPQPTPSASDPEWVSISVPTGAGNTTPGNVQLDINNLRAQSQFFNIGTIPQGTYNAIQVVLDQSQPGMVVPTCLASSGFEGCINYPMALFNPAQAVQVQLSAPFNASANNLSTLLLTLGVVINGTPASTGGGSYLVTPTLEVNPVNSSNKSNLMGTIPVAVNVSGSPGSHVRPLTITAESAGTRNVVATLSTVNPGTQYLLTLPAAPNGTSYDIYVNGGGYSFAAVKNVSIMPAVSAPLLNLNVGGVAQNGFSGQITNGCAGGAAIPGALIELLAPPSNSTVNCSTDLTSASQCVIVGSDFSDNIGNYPLPATTTTPSLLSEVPVGSNYAMLISANGFGSILSQASLSSSAQNCTQSDVVNGCSFSMNNSTLTGTVTLGEAPQPGTSVQVQVFAEKAGTNQLVSALNSPLIFGSANTSQNFSINVPPQPTASPTPAQSYDLFAVAIDPYLGATSPFTGHTIAAVSNAASGPIACATAPITGSLGPLDCAGHGSITGSVANPDQNTTVEVLQDNVFITGTAPGFLESGGGSPPLPANTNFSFCVPPGQYTVQKYENGVPEGNPTSVPVATPTSVSSPSPCPSSCSQTATTCPGQCLGGPPIGPL